MCGIFGEHKFGELERNANCWIFSLVNRAILSVHIHCFMTSVVPIATFWRYIDIRLF